MVTSKNTSFIIKNNAYFCHFNHHFSDVIIWLIFANKNINNKHVIHGNKVLKLPQTQQTLKRSWNLYAKAIHNQPTNLEPFFRAQLQKE